MGGTGSRKEHVQSGHSGGLFGHSLPCGDIHPCPGPGIPTFRGLHPRRGWRLVGLTDVCFQHALAVLGVFGHCRCPAFFTPTPPPRTLSLVSPVTVPRHEGEDEDDSLFAEHLLWARQSAGCGHVSPPLASTDPARQTGGTEAQRWPSGPASPAGIRSAVCLLLPVPILCFRAEPSACPQHPTPSPSGAQRPCPDLGGASPRS